jgi:hypothetical protein
VVPGPIRCCPAFSSHVVTMLLSPRCPASLSLLCLVITSVLHVPGCPGSVVLSHRGMLLCHSSCVLIELSLNMSHIVAQMCRGVVTLSSLISVRLYHAHECEFPNSVLKSSLVRFFASKRGNWQLQDIKGP